MRIGICSDEYSENLKNILINYVKELGHDLEVVEEGEDTKKYFNNIVNVSEKAVKGDIDRVIFLDEVGAKSFMISSKVKGMITACVSDEHSARMTRDHNGALGLALGSDLIGETLAKSMVKTFIEKEFSAGRHMVRIDMLNKMA